MDFRYRYVSSDFKFYENRFKNLKQFIEMKKVMVNMNPLILRCPETTVLDLKHEFTSIAIVRLHE